MRRVEKGREDGKKRGDESVVVMVMGMVVYAMRCSKSV